MKTILLLEFCTIWLSINVTRGTCGAIFRTSFGWRSLRADETFSVNSSYELESFRRLHILRATEKGKVVFMLHCKKYSVPCFLCVTCFLRRFPKGDCLLFTVLIATISYTVIYDPLQDFQRNGDGTGTLF